MTLREELEMLLKIKTQGGMVARKGYHYSCQEEFVLQEGQEFQGSPLPKSIKPMQLKRCYMNAAILAGDFESLGVRYCEGFARTEFFAMPHAWVIDKDGNVIDPTWQDRGTQYMGVIMPFDYLMDAISTSGHYGVIDDWENDWPILKTKWKYKETIGDKQYANAAIIHNKGRGLRGSHRKLSQGHPRNESCTEDRS